MFLLSSNKYSAIHFRVQEVTRVTPVAGFPFEDFSTSAHISRNAMGK